MSHDDVDMRDTNDSPSNDVDNTSTDNAAGGSSSSTAAAASSSSSSTKKKSTTKSKGKRELEPTEVDPNYPGQRFKLGELIYANYAEGKQWFEAKVLKVEKRGDLIYYYLHYQGWGDKVNQKNRATERWKEGTEDQ